MLRSGLLFHQHPHSLPFVAPGVLPSTSGPLLLFWVFLHQHPDSCLGLQLPLRSALCIFAHRFTWVHSSTSAQSCTPNLIRIFLQSRTACSCTAHIGLPIFWPAFILYAVHTSPIAVGDVLFWIFSTGSLLRTLLESPPPLGLFIHRSPDLHLHCL